MLTEQTIREIAGWKYDGEMIFAFDNIEDKDLIVSKLELIRKTVPDWTRELKFYVFCGCDKNDRYDTEFWENDIRNLFERITILRAYNAKPYIMRHENVYKSRYKSFYATVAAYCNQPSMFKSFSFRLYAQCRAMRKKDYAIYKRDIARYLAENDYKGSEWRSMEMVESEFPEIAHTYYDIDQFTDISRWRKQ